MRDEQNSEEGRYIREWERTLSGLLGWQPDRVATWIEAHRWEMESGAIYHEFPMYYVAIELIPKPLKERLGGLELARLERQIAGELQRFHGYTFDSLGAAEKVDSILRSYIRTERE